MKFKLLLLILLGKLKWAAMKNDAFREYIRNKKLKVAIKTRKADQGRVYVFDGGAISSIPGDRETSDVAMVWCDADTGFKVMSCGNDEASLAALTERKLVIEGNFKEFMWFSTALAKMMTP
jgi:hypothetical protein